MPSSARITDCGYKTVLTGAVFFCLVTTLPYTGSALESLVVEQSGKTSTVEGKILVQALDGGMLLMSRDGMLWPLQPEEIKSRSSDERPFEPLTQAQVGELLLRELPEGFRIHNTTHYIICYNTSQAYAQWCGSLYERLYRGFFNYWKTRGWDLDEPELPLVALVFDSREQFANYARPELGDAVNGVIGYYNMRTNRVTMYDLTGADDIKRIVPRISNSAHINQILSQPGAERTVATIVHEATHQLAYNCGVQVRYAANPMWVSEGLAIFFESPDFKSDRGWRTVGAINVVHLMNFRRYLGARPEDSLLSMLVEDKRFHDGKLVADAYSEAWALNYFLLNRRREQYVAFLKVLSEKKPLLDETPQVRLEAFKQAFGDLKTLDEEFVKYMQKLR